MEEFLDSKTRESYVLIVRQYLESVYNSCSRNKQFSYVLGAKK